LIATTTQSVEFAHVFDVPLQIRKAPLQLFGRFSLDTAFARCIPAGKLQALERVATSTTAEGRMAGSCGMSP